MSVDAQVSTTGRYPRSVRDSRFKCVSCNAPVARTVDDRFVCVGCGESPIRTR